MITILFAAVAAIFIAMALSPRFLRDARKSLPVHRIKWRFREMRGLTGPTNEVHVQPLVGDAGGIIESRRLCFGLLLGAISLGSVLGVHALGAHSGHGTQIAGAVAGFPAILVN